jgi:hypothetical protein
MRDSPASGVAARLARMRQRLAGRCGLAEARLRLAAGGAGNALAAVPCILSLGGVADSGIRRAAELRDVLGSPGCGPRDPGYARRPFRAAEHGAPFILIGDPV